MITVQEAAERLKVTPKAIYYALTEGNLTRHEQYGRILLDEEEVARYKPNAGANRPSKRRRRQNLMENSTP